MNSKWPLWIAASINKHFSDELTPVVVRVFIEGQHRGNDLAKSLELVEVRTDGPYYQQYPNKLWKLTYEINLLATRVLDDKNNYKIWNLIGKCSEASSKVIRVFDYEEGNTTPKFIGCLNRMTGKDGRDDVKVHYFGQVEPTVKLCQVSIETHYYIELEDR